MYFSTSGGREVTTLLDRACMHMNISYINMCKLNKNRERRKELEKERERLVVMVCMVGLKLWNSHQ
jgi:hypothetical protein